MAKKQIEATDKKRTTKKAGTTKRKAMKRTKISWIVKSDGMSLTEWQVALRKQIAQEEHFCISCVDDKLLPGEYSVKSPKTRQEYKVVYRGAASEWNYCSCFDFKTAQLGTCKHLEAVKLWIDGNRRAKVHKEIPPYTSVYLKYLPMDGMAGDAGDVRKVCIRIGSDHREEYQQLAQKYFDRNGVMLEDAYQKFTDFVIEANHISDTFRFYQDAIDFIFEKREANASTFCTAIPTRCSTNCSPPHSILIRKKASDSPSLKAGVSLPTRWVWERPFRLSALLN